MGGGEDGGGVSFGDGGGETVSEGVGGLGTGHMGAERGRIMLMLGVCFPARVS